jgi:hypothetical protein
VVEGATFVAGSTTDVGSGIVPGGSEDSVGGGSSGLVVAAATGAFTASEVRTSPERSNTFRMSSASTFRLMVGSAESLTAWGGNVSAFLRTCA